MSTVVLERARSRRTGTVNPRTVATVLQVLEAHHDAERERSTPTIVVPQVDGSMLPLAHYQIQRMEPALEQQAMDQHNRFIYDLHHGAWETVENTSDEDFICALNGADYTVPARGTKQLPSPLAQQYRQKLSQRAKMAAYDKAMGAAYDGQQINVLDFERQFKPAVQSINALHETHYDHAARKTMF